MTEIVGVEDEWKQNAAREYMAATKKYLLEPSSGTFYAMMMAKEECLLLGIDIESLRRKTVNEVASIMKGS